MKTKEDASVKISNLVKTYTDDRGRPTFTAVKNINLEIKNGEFMVLVDPSGCGKSTTLRMVAGLEKISSGQDTKAGGRVIRYGFHHWNRLRKQLCTSNCRRLFKRTRIGSSVVNYPSGEHGILLHPGDHNLTRRASDQARYIVRAGGLREIDAGGPASLENFG